MIKSIIFDYDGVFTLDDYSAVLSAFHKSSGISEEEIKRVIGEHERKWVVEPESTQFLLDLKREFNFPGSVDEIATLLNQRGDSGLYELLPRFETLGLKMSILSNQISYRVPHVRQELDRRFGLSKFQKIYFSPEIGLQKPFVGVTHDLESEMDISTKDIFPLVVKDMRNLGYSPNDCLFIDDSPANIKSAQKQDLNGLRFENLSQMRKELVSKYNVQV